MTDGTGVTTYNYYPVTSGQLGAGMLSSVSNSFIGASSVVGYSYDALGRVTNRAINGVAQQLAFDALHRVIELDTPTIARVVPVKIRRWAGFSAMNIKKSSPTSN